MRNVILGILLVMTAFASAQVRRQPTASEIKLKLKKLNFLGSVLYVAAHPDDENTRAIAYLASDRMAATAYLSMTRGDGGQNLIGSEIRDQLGLIRTQELLAARKIDGGRQYFTRANDFGFSKNVKETFEIWNKEEILSDVVRIYRQFQPDVILTRFPADERAGHGHHTASAVLAQEAFDVSGRKDFLPEQVKQFGTWQPVRLFTNTGRWWNQTINENTPGVITLNVGTYNPLLGKSFAEIAAESRTQHKSQGFGSPGRRGDAPEYFEFEKGDKPVKDIFDGINTTWSRVPGGEKVTVLVNQAVNEYKGEDPAASVPLLLKIRSAIQSLPASVWRERKINEVNELIQDCLGLFAEATASYYWAAPGDPFKATFEIINRAGAEVTLQGIHSTPVSFDSAFTFPLKKNFPVSFKSDKKLNSNLTYSDPYWLRQPHTQGLFVVEDPSLIGRPENDAAVSFTFDFLVNGEKYALTTPLVYKWTDPVKGELSRPFEVVPPVFINLDKKVYIFRDESAHEVTVLVKSSKDKITGTLQLNLPSGWKSNPVSVPFELNKRGAEQSFTFKVTPSKEEVEASLSASATVDGKIFDFALHTIQYDHIPAQILLPKASAEALRLNIKKEGSVIGYIKGAGDEVPTGLRNMGYEVWEMKNEEVTAANLKKVDAVVLGVRALNTNERIRYFMPALLHFVKEGGTMVVQYNTNFDMEIDADKFSPFSLTLSRDRVTQENSEVRILKPDHAILNSPNKITSEDFQGWVQERGLYFPSAWAPEFEAVLSMNDAGEPAKDGSLLVAKYGNGHYVYTGLSFFRELPEGVPGAYKLFANLVSLGRAAKPTDVKVKTKSK
jgi:LmbE family N-acetylglucosaminyl deacetylase